MLTSKPTRIFWLRLAFVAAVFALWLLHWPHLRADFPNNSPWEDYAKYTDEGWYSNAAVRAKLFGHALLPGDFNPGVALPVWPALEWIVFSFSGVSLIAARGLALFVFGGNLILSYAVLRAAGASRLGSSAAVLLLAGSMYLWAFSRLAILEPLLIFWTLAAWLMALRLPLLTGRKRGWALLAIGLLGCLAVLTKTTAVFLLPASAVLVGWAVGWRLRPTAAALGVALVGGVVPWLTYFLLVARPRFLDYHYLFVANTWVKPMGLHERLTAYWFAVRELVWVGPELVFVMLVLLVTGLAISAGFRRSPLVHASLLSYAGYMFFICWHNSSQPRYYMVLLYPVIFVTVLAIEALARGRRSRWAVPMAALALTVVFVRDVRSSLWYVGHPEYTLANAAAGLTAYIDHHSQDGRRMLLSISGDEITLFTHLPAICDDFGTDDLPTRIDRYRPGWYAEWNELDPGTLEDIHSAGYRLRAVAHWHALDDEDRDDLILYRMVPLTPAERAAIKPDDDTAPSGH